MCHRAPDTSDAPSRAPPAAVSQYRDWAVPPTREAADPVDRKRTRMSAELFPLTEPEWTGRLIDVMVPPRSSRRGEPEYFSAPATEAHWP